MRLLPENNDLHPEWVEFFRRHAKAGILSAMEELAKDEAGGNGRSSDDGSGGVGEEFLTVKEAAALARCKRGKIYRLMADGHLGKYNFGRSTLIKRDELLALIERER